MKVLRNHFNNNPTIIIDGRIINGCQNFTLIEAPDILIRHEVPADVWQQVLDVYTDEVDSEKSVVEFLNDSDWRVRRIIANYGYGLNTLINDPDWHVRLAIAEQGYGLEVFVNDPDWCVRLEVAEQGYGLDTLVNDPNLWVRKAAATKYVNGRQLIFLVVIMTLTYLWLTT